MAEKEAEKEKESSRRARGEWERERDAMREAISKLRDGMRENHEKLKKMEGKHEVGVTFDPQSTTREEIDSLCFASYDPARTPNAVVKI